MWQTLAENMIPVIFMIITPVVTLFVSLLLRKLAKKWHMESALVYSDKVDELVVKGIKAVEQKSLSAVKKGGEMTPGEKKLDDALKFVNAQLAAMKLPEKAAEELKMLIEAKLFDGAKLPAPVAPPVVAPVVDAPAVTPAQ
jgi:hypothetical protein